MIKMKKGQFASIFAKLSMATALAISLGTANGATLLGQEPDPSLIVDAGTLEWVYAGPCAGTDPSCGVVQLHHGFNFATDEQWNQSFASIAELLAAFTIPAPKCAAPYFNVAYDHCDFGDASLGYIWHSPLAPTVSQRNHPASETFLVRVASNNVPEPATAALLGLGLFGFAVSRRKSAKNKNA